MTTQACQRVEVQLTSRVSIFKTRLNCLVVHQITQAIHAYRVNVCELRVLTVIQLADPKFYESSLIDLLLGAEIFFDLMCMSRVKVAKDQPTWQKTLLGWIVTGGVKTSATKRKASTICNLITNEQLGDDIARFWCIENNNRQVTRSSQERWCEDHFRQTYARN